MRALAGVLVLLGCGGGERSPTPAVAPAEPAPATPVAPAMPPADAAPPEDGSLRAQIEREVAADVPIAKLRKIDVRPAMKTLGPRVGACYEAAHAVDAKISGVVNTKLRMSNAPSLGMILTVQGFDTHGPLGESRPFLDCVTRTFEETVLPPVMMRGQLEFLYPFTFGPDPIDNRDRGVVEAAERLAKHACWADALAEAERGLNLLTLDGAHRHRLIGTAGVAACHLKDEAKARHYFALASPDVEDALILACLDHAEIILTE